MRAGRDKLQKLQVYGCSDDLIEFSGIEGADEFPGYCSDKEPNINGVFGIKGFLRIYAIYSDVGCWCFAVGLWDDGVPLPDWPMKISAHPVVPPHNDGAPYSTLLEIEVPDGLKLERLDASD